MAKIRKKISNAYEGTGIKILRYTTDKTVDVHHLSGKQLNKYIKSLKIAIFILKF